MLSFGRLLYEGQPARARHVQQTLHPVVATAGKHHPNHPGPIGPRRRSEERVHGRSRVMLLGPAIESDAAMFKCHVAVGWGDVDEPTGQEISVGRFDHPQIRFHPKHVSPGRRGVRPSMDHDTDERRQVSGKPREKLDDGTRAARGRAHDDDVSCNPLLVDRDSHGANLAIPCLRDPNIWEVRGGMRRKFGVTRHRKPAFQARTGQIPP
jgi:hypothetical protein